MKMKSILSGLIVIYAACMFLATACSQASNQPTKEPPVAVVSVRYIADAVDAAGAIGITNGRARALVAAGVGLISLVVGGLALARSAGRIGTGNGRAGAIIALVLGLIGMILSVVHLGTSTGGFGTGGGRAGAIVALVLGLIGMNLGGLALGRSRRSGSTA